jgi:UDP-N-acetyl-D-mannosaminuronic acid dehydrogenase
MATICVLGLGYVGLPTACLFAVHGHDVIGVDTDSRRVESLQQGVLPLDEPGLQLLFQAASNTGRLTCRTEPAAGDVFIVAVPTPVGWGNRPDLSFVQAAAESIRPHLRPGALVILESTCPPGTTATLLRGILEQDDLKVGETLFLAHCPERVLPGRILTELVANDRVVGGLTPACTQKAADLYAPVVEGRIHTTSATVAETVKVIENTYRDVNIALANELAVVCDHLGIPASEVITLANHHPRVHLHQPGPGVGGHCIAVDPWFLVAAAPGATTPLIQAARARNDAMPAYVAEQIMAWIGMQQPTIAVLGVSYKGNVADTRESPALDVVADLLRADADVRVHDPLVEMVPGLPLTDLETAVGGADAIVLLADHRGFRDLDPETLGQTMRHRRIYDARQSVDLAAWQRAGFDVRRLGGRHD